MKKSPPTSLWSLAKSHFSTGSALVNTNDAQDSEKTLVDDEWDGRIEKIDPDERDPWEVLGELRTLDIRERKPNVNFFFADDDDEDDADEDDEDYNAVLCRRNIYNTEYKTVELEPNFDTRSGARMVQLHLTRVVMGRCNSDLD